MLSIHPTAIVHSRANVAEDCQIGPYCVIGAHVTLGSGCVLHSHVVLEGRTVLGKQNEIFPFACLGQKTQDLKWRGGETWTRIGDGNTFREYVTVHSATKDGDATVIGSGNHLLAYTHVAHDVVMGDHIILSNAATLAGHVVVEDHAILSGMAGVHQFCRVGRMAIIGGCSKVVQDVLPFMLVDGNPAQTRAINKVGLERNGVSVKAQAAIKQAHKIIFRDGLTLANALRQIEEELPPLPEIRHLLTFARASERGVSK